jgi:hypothetical protein
MRLHSILTSSAVLAALCSMLMGGCGDGTWQEDGSEPALRDSELNGGSGKDKGQGTKITICHVPPGNPDNAHTITVGGPAWGGHQHHPGDYLGTCGGGGGENPGEPDAGVPPTEPDAGTPPPPPPPPPPVCAPSGEACGEGGVVCCAQLECVEGACQPILQ